MFFIDLYIIKYPENDWLINIKSFLIGDLIFTLYRLEREETIKCNGKSFLQIISFPQTILFLQTMMLLFYLADFF